MMYSYKTKGTCSRQIDVELDGDVIKDVKFYGGCAVKPWRRAKRLSRESSVGLKTHLVPTSLSAL